MGSTSSSGVGFILSFTDEASKPLGVVTDAYNAMTKAMAIAQKKAADTLGFSNGMSKIAKALEHVTRSGYRAVSALTAVSGVSSGISSNSFKLNITHKIPKMAKGGIIKKPTLVQAGEAGPEAIVPLKRSKIPQIAGLQGSNPFEGPDKGVPKAWKETFQRFGGVKKEWFGVFGPKSKIIWKDITKGSKKFKDDTEEIATNVKDTKFLTAIRGISEAIDKFQSFRGIAGKEGMDSFIDATNELSKSRGLDRKAVLEQRKMLRIAYKGMVADVDEAASVYNRFADESFALTRETAKLSAEVAAFGKLTGVDVTQQIIELQKQLGLSGDEFMKVTTSARLAGNTIGVSFEKVFESAGPALDAIKTLKKDIPEVAKPTVIKSIYALSAGLEKSGVDAKTSAEIMSMLNSSLTDFEMKKSLMKAGIDPLAAMREGKPEKMLETLTRFAESVKAGSLGGLKMGQIYQDKFGAASDALLGLRGHGEEAVSVMKQFIQLEKSGSQDIAAMTEESKKQMTIFGSLSAQFGNWLSTRPYIGELTESLSKVAPVIEGIYAASMLFRGFPGMIKKWSAAIMGFLIPSLGAQKKATVATNVATKALNITMLMNPIGLIVLGVMALVAGFILLYKKSDVFRASVDKLWSRMKPLVQMVAHFAGVVLKKWIDMMGIAASFIIDVVVWAFDHWRIILAPFLPMLTAIGFVAKQVFSIFSSASKGEGMLGWIKKGIDALMKSLGPLWDKVKGLWDLIFTNKHPVGTQPIQPKAVVSDSGILVNKKESQRTIATPVSRDTVKVDNADVVDTLDKILGVLTDIKNGKKTTGGGGAPRGFITADGLALRGE